MQTKYSVGWNIMSREQSVGGILQDAEGIVAEMLKQQLRKRRKTEHTMMVPRGIAVICNYLMMLIEHHKKQGVKTSRKPVYLDRVIVQLKKIRWKTVHTIRGQGRLEVATDATTMLPSSVAKMVKMLSKMIIIYDKKGWEKSKKVPARIARVLKELITIRRKQQCKRVQG